MATIEETIAGFIPSSDFIGGFFSVGVWLIFIFIFAVISAIVTYLIVVRLRYNNKVIIWQKIGNNIEIIGRDRAMGMPLSRFGEQVLYLKKRKKYLPMPDKQVGRRMFFYFIRKDGQWINVSMDDIDELTKKLRIHFTDKSTNYARTQIDRALKERYDKPNFFEKYGVLIVSITFVVLLGILTWLLFDKWIDLAGATSSGVEQLGIVTEKTGVMIDRVTELLEVMENICQGGSGVIPR